ncbi:hypothetical protein [Streptomyces sp. NPDC002164]
MATDAVTDKDADAPRNSVGRILPRPGEADTTDASVGPLGG